MTISLGLQTLISLVMTAQAMSFRYELTLRVQYGKGSAPCDIAKLSLLFYKSELYIVS